LVSPALDLLKILMLVNKRDEGLDCQRLAGQMFPSLPAFLAELSKALPNSITPNPDLTQTVKALKSVHEAFQSNAREDRGGHENTYREIRELEAKLREQSTAVDHLLGQRSGEPGSKAVLRAFQQALFLQCPQGGRTAGRFRCVNRTGKPAYVDIRPRSCRGAEASLEDQAIVEFAPTNRRLEPQEAGLFCASVDLSRCQHVRGETLEIDADVYLSGELALKLFISVEVYDEQPEGVGCNARTG
jgi:hypothetical protein